MPDEVALEPPVSRNNPDTSGSIVGDVYLVYKIQGGSQEVPLFELARTLEAVGAVIQQADRVVSNQPHSMVV